MLVATGIAGVVATCATAWAVAKSPILVNPTGDVIWRSLFVGVYVAVGAYTWCRRAESPLGPLVARLGFVYAVTSLNAAGAPLAHTIGMVVWAGYNAALVEELHMSRLWIAETGDREPRRLERDLHDGAQQRLMAIQIKLRMLEESTADEEIARQLDAIGIDAEAAVAELRSLAHGIYPPVLRDYGLSDALRSFAMLTPTRIAIVDNGIGRCQRAIESAIYFCSMEAIQNVVKHAGQGARATVTLERDGGRAGFAISDDGIGMDISARGDGDSVGSMRDRIGAVGGELRIASTPGVGTTVRGSVPLDHGVAGTRGWADTP